MSLEILVDGYNIIKRSSSFQRIEARNFAAARSELINQLHLRFRHTPHRVTIVFDGEGSSEQISHQHRIRVMYSRQGEKADHVIARLAAEYRANGREVKMYSDDTEVQRAVAKEGGSVQSSGQLTNQLNQPSKDVARRAQYRQAMRRKYGLDPSYDPDDEPESQYSHGKKKKSSRHRK